MTVRGDLAAALVSKFGLSLEFAKEIIDVVLEAANDPNFAIRYAREAEDTDSDNNLMLVYWDVIKFLKWSNP